MAIVPDMVGMVVRDMGAALRFYRMLDLAIPEGNDGEDYVEVITPNGYRLSWNSEKMVREIEPGGLQPVGQRVGLAFKCDTAAEVDAAYARITSAGYRGTNAPWDAFWGQRYACILDPDGCQVDLFAWLPKEVNG